MEEFIKTKEITKQFKEATVLNQVSMKIPKGAVYGLIGNNGAGKTTLMRILVQLQNATSGHVVRNKSLKIGAVIETPALYPLRSARGNLKYHIKIAGEKQENISELLKLVHLADTRKKVINYSLGMKQRLALALAFVGKPDILILDEPLNGLDPEGIRDMRSILTELNQTYGTTILISSHILGELQKVATHYGFLKNGQLIYECAAEEIGNEELEKFYFENFV